MIGTVIVAVIVVEWLLWRALLWVLVHYEKELSSGMPVKRRRW